VKSQRPILRQTPLRHTKIRPLRVVAIEPSGEHFSPSRTFSSSDGGGGIGRIVKVGGAGGGVVVLGGAGFLGFVVVVVTGGGMTIGCSGTDSVVGVVVVTGGADGPDAKVGILTSVFAVDAEVHAVSVQATSTPRTALMIDCRDSTHEDNQEDK
jgi:hypothetical protein